MRTSFFVAATANDHQLPQTFVEPLNEAEDVSLEYF